MAPEILLSYSVAESRTVEMFHHHHYYAAVRIKHGKYDFD